MHKIKLAYKKAQRHWQHDETGYVCTSTFKPSNRWYQITKKQYEDYLADVVGASPGPAEEAELFREQLSIAHEEIMRKASRR